MKTNLKKASWLLFYLCLCLLIFGVLIPFLRFKINSSQIITRRKVLVIGHRGAGILAPENTLSSFRRAIAMGVDMVELDVHLSADDSVIVMHDPEVSRTTNGQGEIRNLTYAALKKLDAGQRFSSAFKGEQIPTLSEVLQLVNGKCKVLVELKWPNKGTYINLPNLTAKLIRQYHATNWVIIHSFETSYLKEINSSNPDLTCQQLVFGQSWLLPLYVTNGPKLGYFKPLAGISGINTCYFYATAAFIDSCHRHHETVFTFMGDNVADMSRSINLGVDGLITDRPDLAIKLTRR